MTGVFLRATPSTCFSCFTLWVGAWLGGGGAAELAALQNKVVWEKEKKEEEKRNFRASLKPALHDQSLAGDVTGCGFHGN